jgi:type IV pilus assembly protein PilB
MVHGSRRASGARGPAERKVMGSQQMTSVAALVDAAVNGDQQPGRNGSAAAHSARLNGHVNGQNGASPGISLAKTHPDRSAIAAVPLALAQQLGIVPVEHRGDVLVVAMADPGDVHTIDAVSRAAGCRVSPVAATPMEIQMAIGRFYGAAPPSPAPGPAAATAARRPPETMAVLEADATSPEDAPVIRLLNQVLTDAVGQGASDIHIEPHEAALLIRYRIDGMLSDWLNLPPAEHPPLVSRVKILGNMDIAKNRVPLDGRFTTQIRGQRWDVRVSTVPGVFGESAVLRLLPKDTKSVALDQLGMQDRELQTFASLIAKPYGMVLVTGPTGAGKTTTLYTVLQQMDCVGRKILTIEDPVEYELPRVTQIQVHPKIGLTFAAGLRHILRQDPDILMVGEIRDPETLEMAVQAALTGHLVFSTLHCNDAASAAVRCLDMDLEPFLFSSSVIGVVAQRLVRKICTSCRAAEPLPTALAARMGVASPNAVCYRGRGCAACRQTGYRGRLGVFEVLVLNDAIKEAIQGRAPASEIRRIAAHSGMRSLRYDAVEKVRLGFITPEEVLRAVYLEGE